MGWGWQVSLRRIDVIPTELEGFHTKMLPGFMARRVLVGTSQSNQTTKRWPRSLSEGVESQDSSVLGNVRILDPMFSWASQVQSGEAGLPLRDASWGLGPCCLGAGICPPPWLSVVSRGRHGPDTMPGVFCFYFRGWLE